MRIIILTLNPCHGKEPRKKYIKTKPKLSISSLLLCSIPKCVLIDAYRAVPVKFLPYQYQNSLINSLIVNIQFNCT